MVELSLADGDAAVASGRVDVAFLRDPVVDSRLRIVPLYATARVAAVAATHPLARRAAVTVADLDGLPITAVNRYMNAATRRVYGLEAERNGDRRRVVESVTLAEAVVNIVIRGAVATPSAASARYLTVPGVSFVPLVDARPSGPIAACRRDDHRATVGTFMAVAEHVARSCRALVPDAVAVDARAAAG